MVGYKQHIIISFLIVAFVLLILSYYNLFKFSFEALKLIPIIVIFSILPDIDIKTSKISKYTLKGLLLLVLMLLVLYLIYSIVLIIYYVLFIVVFLILSTFFKHRGKFHSLVFSILLASPLLFLGLFEFLSGLLAYLGHLIVDSEFKLL
tara:strand:+ start:354 stop:800 length:447 start_codon:yes stop_codon:yes gene_type:complete